jgi:serine/threonine protein kinase/tetratricopeptide (TPR) repeat protein
LDEKARVDSQTIDCRAGVKDPITPVGGPSRPEEADLHPSGPTAEGWLTRPTSEVAGWSGGLDAPLDAGRDSATGGDGEGEYRHFRLIGNSTDGSDRDSPSVARRPGPSESWISSPIRALGPDFPAVGDHLAGFRLLAELGRGALGRVFLASQPDLSDRPVVLKVTPLRGAEHRSLARLQHTHIVPLLSVHDLAERGLRILCLSYLGGTTLERIWEELADRPPRRRQGRDLLTALDRAAGPASSLPAVAPARGFLAASSYERALCWIAYCLAQALHHAHERGLIHLDLKPDNVLIAADGMPLLLDFHLARPPIRVGDPEPDALGGTPGFMAPEQSLALDAMRGGWSITAAVDARADVYALGVLLYQGLTASLYVPGAPGGIARRLRRENQATSWGLADVVARCLEPDPRRRYPDASALAEDLRRHLDDRPLGGVPNRSVVERWSKWRRSRPDAVAGVGALAAAALGVWAASFGLWHGAGRRFADAEDALAQGRWHLAARDIRGAALSLQHGLDLIAPSVHPALAFSGTRELRRDLLAELGRTRAAGLLHELHSLADRVRFLDASGPPDPASARGLERRLSALWRSRGAIERQLTGTMDPEVKERVRGDLLDLAILWAELRIRLADDAGRDGARREASRTFSEAEAAWGPSPVLEEQRRYLGLERADAGTSRRAVGAIGGEPRSAWEWQALGRSSLRSGRLEAAAAALDRAADLQPQSLWTQFYRGQCALRGHQFAAAVDAFGACVALAPREGACYYNRGLAYEGLGVADRARHDFDRARRLDPTLPRVGGPGVPDPARSGGTPGPAAHPAGSH